MSSSWEVVNRIFSLLFDGSGSRVIIGTAFQDLIGIYLCAVCSRPVYGVFQMTKHAKCAHFRRKENFALFLASDSLIFRSISKFGNTHLIKKGGLPALLFFIIINM